MSDELQHDPRTKSQIKNALYEYLYTPVIKEFDARLDAIVTRNTTLGGYNHRSFIYRDVVYNREPTVMLPRKMNRLQPQLQPPMNDYLKDLKELNEQELPYVLGFIQAVLNSSNDLHDYLRILPSSVHKPIQGLIATCPCRTKKLSDEAVDALAEKNKAYIEMMRNRMVLNILI